MALTPARVLPNSVRAGNDVPTWRWVLQHLLELEPADRFMFVFDDSTARLRPELTKAARALRLEIIDLQIAPNDPYDAPYVVTMKYIDHVDDSSAAIIALDDAPETAEFRQHLANARQAWLRVATMPGIRRQDLRFCRYPVETVERTCSDLQVPLWRGDVLRITTGYGSSRYVMEARLASIERLPVISTGKIERGQYGNVPGGAVIVVPVERTAKGEFLVECLPGSPSVTDTTLVLQIAQGCLLPAESPSPARQHLDRLLQRAGFDPASEVPLGRIAIGANPGVDRFVGRPLIDSKRLGSVCLWFGGNADMGGSIEVKAAPPVSGVPRSVAVDGSPLVDRGCVTLDVDDWLDAHSLRHHRGELPPHLLLSAVEGGHAIRQDRLLAVRHDDRGRQCHVRCCPTRLETPVATIMDALEHRGALSLTELQCLLLMPPDVLAEAVANLAECGVLTAED